MYENENERNDDRIVSVKRTMEQIFDKIDSGAWVNVKDVFKEMRLDTPPEYVAKIAEYKAKADILKKKLDDDILEKRNQSNRQDIKQTTIKKEVVEESVSPVNNEPEPSLDTDIDYTSMYGSFDNVPLPSKGLIGGINKDAIAVSFLTAIDESIFMQHNISKTKDIFLLLLKNKIIDKTIDVKKLHHGDINAILLFLRYNAFGKDYDIICKVGDEMRKATIDITKIKMKSIELTPNENGYFEYKFVDGNTGEDNVIEFKYFNQYDEDEIQLRLEKDKENKVDTDFNDFYRIVQSIVSINGITDRKEIENFAKYKFNYKDSKKYKKYVIENEPGVEFSYDIDKSYQYNEDGSLGGERDGFRAWFDIGLDMFVETE